MELKTTDLRIGNLLHGGTVVGLHDGGEIKVYDGYATFSSNSMSEQWRSEQPIELNSDIVIKAGFKPCRPNSGVLKLDIKYADSDFPCSLQVSGDGIQICRSGVGAICAPVQYLHQLQNLFKVLTGTELNITL